VKLFTLTFFFSREGACIDAWLLRNVTRDSFRLHNKSLTIHSIEKSTLAF